MAPEWMHEQITAEQYDSWPEEWCRGIEIVDGRVVVMTPAASKWHSAIGMMLGAAFMTADRPSWRAATDFDLRIQDVPLVNLRPDIVVFRADTIGVSPIRPDDVLLVVEIVSPGSETADRVTKPVQYARAGIKYYWRIEDATSQRPVVHTYTLDEAEQIYRATEVFTGVVNAVAPLPVEIDLTDL